MKTLHQPNLFSWASFDEARNIDFNSYLWVRAEGNIVIDPMPLSEHDSRHLTQLGGVAWVLVTNSDHVRDSANIAKRFGANIAAPAAEREGFPIVCQRWLSEGDELVDELRIIELHGSKTAGELALMLADHTLITGDLVRAHNAGSLMLLPKAKLRDDKAAHASVRRLLDLGPFQAVLVGDGWPVFRDGHKRMRELVDSLPA